MILNWPPKDPDEVLDYSFDWGAPDEDGRTRLDGDTIAVSTWSVFAGSVAISDNSHTLTITTVWLSGGTLDEICQITNRIVTVGGRTMEQTARLRIRAK